MTKTVKRSDMEQLAQYRAHLCENPRLTYLFFELTDACNLCCLHCGSNACPQNKTYLPVEAVKAVLDRVAGAFSPRSIMICLTGGEPLLHPHLFEIIAHAKACGFSCGMTTNGTLIDAAAAQKLVCAGIDSVTFSLDGLEDTHDRFRNKQGTFAQTLRGIGNLLAAARGSVATQITTVIQCIYGPMPVKRTRQCTQCKKTWKTCLMVDHEDFCPECGAPAKIIQPGGNKLKDFLGEWFAKEPTMIGGMEEITLDPTVKPD